MAEREANDVVDVSGSACDHPGATESPKSAEDEENSERPAALYNQDLKSVLVTSVLNLEKLDVDLYR